MVAVTVPHLNHLHFGDNLPFLRRYVRTASVDSVHLDPPFNSNRSFSVSSRRVAPKRRRRCAAEPFDEAARRVTLDALVQHQAANRRSPKVVVWEHNSHVGDARSISMSHQGELNVGHLVRQRFGADHSLLLGFTTYDGTVTAASDWGGVAERKRVRRALPGSVEDLFHEVGHPRFLLRTRLDEGLAESPPRPSAPPAIGVISRPETEFVSHYMETHVADQFDVVIHIDHTTE